MNTLLSLVALATLGLQDKPQDIPRKDLPKSAECVVCTLSGHAHGKEKPAGGVMYKGRAYYFCNSDEIAAFKKNPEAYMPPVLPRPVSDFSLTDSSGKLWNNAAMRGKLVMVDYWATWCAPCKSMFPVFDKLFAKYKDKNFVLLSVSVDAKRPDFDKFMKSHKFPNPVMHDSSGTFGKWGVRSIPALFLVKDGQVIAQWTGIQSEKTLDQAIAANLPKP